MLLNKYLIIGSVIAITLSGGVGYVKGRFDGAGLEQAKQAKKEQLIRETRDATIDAAAEEIAKIEVKHTTINRRIERETLTNTFYRECRHTPDGLRWINAALEGKEPADSSELP